MLQGKALDEPAVVAKALPVAGLADLADPPAPLETTPVADSSAAPGDAGRPEKLLSLDDVKLLTKDSDFKPFMAREVVPDVRNAAMRKLFTDPHYNVMDGLDIYIDDYSIADPIPELMLRQMVGSKLLKIFDDEDDEALETPVLAAEGEAVISASSEGGAVDVADDSQATLVLPLDETPTCVVLPEPDVVHASALSSPHEAGQQENLHADTADPSLTCHKVRLLPRISDSEGKNRWSNRRIAAVAGALIRTRLEGRLIFIYYFRQHARQHFQQFFFWRSCANLGFS